MTLLTETISAFLSVVPAAFILIVLISWFIPESDTYFSRTKPVIAEIDDRLDALLLEWDNKTLAGVSDIVSEIRQGLVRAGYRLDEIEEEKLETHIKASLHRKAEMEQGLSISRDLKDGLKISYRKDF